MAHSVAYSPSSVACGMGVTHGTWTHPSASLYFETKTTSINYANPVYDVAAICHQVRCLRREHPSLSYSDK